MGSSNLIAHAWGDVKAALASRSSVEPSLAEANPLGDIDAFLVHGFRGSFRDFAPLVDSMTAAGLKVGGVSYSATDPVRSGTYALARALKSSPPTTKVCLIGHSLGGVLAARAALSDPESVSGVVVLAAPLGGSSWARIPGSARVGLDLLKPDSEFLSGMKLLGHERLPVLCIAGSGDVVARPARAILAPGPGRRGLVVAEGHHSILLNPTVHSEVADFVSSRCQRGSAVPASAF